MKSEGNVRLAVVDEADRRQRLERVGTWRREHHDATKDGERWLARLSREPLLIEIENGPRILAKVLGRTPGEVFNRLAMADGDDDRMPPPRVAVAGELPRHGLGTG